MPTFLVNPSSFSTSAEAGSAPVAVFVSGHASNIWYLESKPSWVHTVQPITGNGNTTVSIFWNANPYPNAERVGNVVFALDSDPTNYNDDVEITQAAGEDLRYYGLEIKNKNDDLIIDTNSMLPRFLLGSYNHSPPTGVNGSTDHNITTMLTAAFGHDWGWTKDTGSVMVRPVPSISAEGQMTSAVDLVDIAMPKRRFFTSGGSWYLRMGEESTTYATSTHRCNYDILIFIHG